MKLEWVGRDLVSRRLTLEQYLLVSVEAAAASPTFRQRYLDRTGRSKVAPAYTQEHELGLSFVVTPEHEGCEGT